MKKTNLHLVNLKALIRSTNGKIFRVNFIKKDGTLRKMVCRIKVRKNVNGNGHPIGLHSAVIRVFDMQKLAFRSIPLDRVLDLLVARKEYQIV